MNAQNPYLNKTDLELVKMSKDGDKKTQDYLIDKYKNLISLKARLYFIIGADKEDLVQEGMIGVYKAIRDYDFHKGSAFYAFAEICITRQIITAIKAATRQKHIPLNTYVSLNKSVYDQESEKTYFDLLTETRVISPEELLIEQEDKNSIEAFMLQALSRLECQVLSLYLQGKSYVQIAAIIKKDEKSIDNALQRIRKKIEKFLDRRSPCKNSKNTRNE